MLIPVAVRSEAYSAPALLLGLQVRIPLRTCTFVSCVCCVLCG